MPLTLRSAVATFGTSTRAKLSNPAASGQPEDQLRGPLEQLLGDLAELAGVARGTVQFVGETSLADLKIRPDYAATVANALVGFVEVKAPGKGADPRRYRDAHDRAQWDKLRSLPNLLYTDGNEFALWRSGELTDAQFADGYAQAVTFGLLVAKARDVPLADGLDRAARALGKRNSLIGAALRLLTDDADNQQTLQTSLGTLVRVLDVVHWPTLSRGKSDAWLYFYEDFLQVYDSRLRKQTGSYYTPAPVVDAMVRLVDEALARPDGFALHRKADRERPVMGDRRPPSKLGDIQPDHWPADYTTELLNVLHVLGRLVALEPAQAALLDRICAGRTYSAQVLRDAGALDAPDGTPRQPRASESAEQVSLLLD